jgi:hypothetical protein
MVDMKRKLLAATILAAGTMVLTAEAQAGLVVTATDNVNTLISALIGSGITVTGGQTYVPAGTTASGTFTNNAVGGATGIDFSSGVLLTSGNALDAPGPNNSDSQSTANGAAGDADLNALIPGYSTHDATILQFDFQFGDGSVGGDLFFNYQFASEEYNEYVGSVYNDVFGLFVDGTNVAIAGDGSTVSINNVNCGDPYNAAHVGDNCNQYQNNDPTNGVPTPLNIEYDGLTTVLQAKALGLAAGTHTLKLAIADAGDFIYDSGLFIQGNSISDQPTAAPEPGTLAMLGTGLLGFGFVGWRRRSTS